MLLNHERVVLEDGAVVRAALEWFRQKTVVGFKDCLVLELARKAGHLPLLTFDPHLGKLDGAQRL